MATGISTKFDVAGTRGFTVRTYVSETYDPVTNKSVLSVDPKLISTMNGNLFYLAGSVSVDGTKISDMLTDRYESHAVNFMGTLNQEFSISAGSGYTAPPWKSGEITHESDGSKSVTISIEISGMQLDGTYYWEASGSVTIDLTHIPRASTIGATDANIGSKSAVVVTRKSTAYTHSIAYKFGNLSGYITAAGGVSASEVKFSNTNIAFTIPTTFYAQIPDAASGVCTLTIKTYSGSTQIGEAQTDTFTVTAAQSLCAPSVSGSVVDSNATTKALTGDESKLVRYYSTALCTITARAKNSAAIAQKKIAGTVVSGNTRSIAAVESDTFAFYAKDSRGYEGSDTVEVDLIPYVLLTCNPVGKRTDGTSGKATLAIKGNYYNGSFGAAANSLTVKYRIKPYGGNYGSYVTLIPTISGDTYSVGVYLSNLDYQKAYVIEVVVADKLASITKEVPIKRGIPVFDWGKDDFRINVALRLLGAAYGTSLPTTGKEGQVFFLLSNGSYTVKIHNGTSWT